ncbi:hypothetical protein WNY63_20155 [Pseudoalteromonas neustonica]|uniref:Uncharacterized protein n=1 Tax=Pseudoalteromonas neustonica TaxID=1840331 RepID=A0ABU9U7M8_9GAMM
MIKHLLTVCFLGFLLSGCGESHTQYQTKDHALQTLQTLNQLLKTNGSIKQVSEEQWPFTNAYLEKRHLIYQGINTFDLEPTEQRLLDYLIIAERFPERYFPWPAHIPVLENMLNYNQTLDISQQIASWINFNQQQLILAKESNLKLNSIELGMLKQQVSVSLNRPSLPSNVQLALQGFNEYLLAYIPRGSAGLHGLANGGPWYQSKLNYFSGMTKPPLNWLVAVQSELKVRQRESFGLTLALDHQYSVLEQWLKPTAIESIGFDWAQNYQDLTKAVLSKKSELTAPDQVFWMAMMETDVGIHYHAWTPQQAKVNLLKHLSLTPQQAQYLVEDIVFYPGSSFSFSFLLDKK